MRSARTLQPSPHSIVTTSAVSSIMSGYGASMPSRMRLRSIVTGLGLQSTKAVPQRFWKMPPHYWPHTMPPGAEAFQSQSFLASGRGHDGDHYFLLHDKTQHRAFVWFKSNF
jgi:hypothetical protein